MPPTRRNAASAANAAKLGGIDAASYVQNNGTIFVSTGSANWRTVQSTDPISWTYTVNATWATSSGAGAVFLTAHPSFSTALFGKNLSATAATLCYSASASAKISEVDIYDSRYVNSGIGSTTLLAADPTDRDRRCMPHCTRSHRRKPCRHWTTLDSSSRSHTAVPHRFSSDKAVSLSRRPRRLRPLRQPPSTRLRCRLPRPASSRTRTRGRRPTQPVGLLPHAAFLRLLEITVQCVAARVGVPSLAVTLDGARVG